MGCYRECKKLLLSKQIFFPAGVVRKHAVQLLLDFEDSIAVEFGRKRAKHMTLRTEDLERARCYALNKARYLKLLQRLTIHEEPMPTLHVVPKTTVATKARSRVDDSDLTA